MFFSVNLFFGQEIIKDSLEPEKPEAPTNKKQMVDGVIATIGDYVVLDSDIDKSLLEIKYSGTSIAGITRCQILGKIMEDKLYAHHALQDSIVVTDSDVKSEVDRRIDYMLQQLGTMDKLLKFYKKDSEAEFRSYFMELMKENKLSSEMQTKIIDKVTITPEEVRVFFKKISENELPVFAAEMELSQIIIEPKVQEEEKKRVIAKLKEFKKDCENGASFSSKAVLYSQDPGSRSSGGFYKMNKKTPFVKEFKNVAFSLEEGQISEPFQTPFGYHIIKIEKIKGQDIELRHILLIPEVSREDLRKAREEILLIRKRILDKEITFEEAAKTLSTDKESAMKGGALRNPQTSDYHFELTKMDPNIYNMVSNLKDGEISLPMLDEDEKGSKKFRIFTVTNKIEEHKADYSNDYQKIRDLALKQKQIDSIGKWFNEKIKQTSISIQGEYKNCVFANNWLKK